MKKQIIISLVAFFLGAQYIYSWSDSVKLNMSIVGLDSAETLKVNIDSHGCMEKIDFKLIFYIGDTGIVSSLIINRDKKELNIGQMVLSIKDASIIDGYLQYLRKPPKYRAECTGSDNISLSWIQWNREIEHEEFYDATCFSVLLPSSFWKVYENLYNCCINKRKKKCNKIGIKCN